MSQAIEERHDQVQSLISMGKERGYVLSGEVTDILSGEVHSSKEIDDLLLTLERSGMDIYEGCGRRIGGRRTPGSGSKGGGRPRR